MTYSVNRARGYVPWGIVNPWVFANYGQPQRGRGYESPMVFQTHPPSLRSPHLGQLTDEDRDRARRMERMAMAGLALSGASFLLFLFRGQMLGMRKNARRRARRKTRRTR